MSDYVNTKKVTRFEVIDHREDSDNFGRTVIARGKDLQFDVELQDDGKTLKVFIHERYEEDSDNE